MLLSEAIEDLQNLTKKRITYQNIADIFGVSAQAIGNRVARKSELATYERKKLEYTFNVNLNVNQDFIDDMNDTSGEIFLDYYPQILGSCGNGTFVMSEIKEDITVPKRLIKNYFPFNEYFVINAYGDSMSPTICNKDFLIVQHITVKEPIKDNEIYVFRYEDSLFVKRLVHNVNCVVIKADNQEYKNVEISGKELSNLEIIGRIVGLMRAF